ncbi:MAG TPA: AfsR/SARP family transcriptional regulator, partial [Pseudonocardiaceae bacterium]
MTGGGVAVDFRLLGPVEAWRDGVEVPLDGAKQRTVLAALLLADGHMVSDDRLCELLWGEEPPATFVAQIYTYVSRLRKNLGDTLVIVRQRPGYLLRGGRLDTREFDRLAAAGTEQLRAGRHEAAAGLLRSALALWRGPALAGVTDRLSEAQARRLEENRLVALAGRVEADLALGRQVDLVPELTALVAAHPLHEGFRVQLMSALARCDRQADALAVYRAGRRELADQLGIDPGPALESAFRAILAGPVPGPRVSAEGRATGPASSAGPVADGVVPGVPP